MVTWPTKDLFLVCLPLQLPASFWGPMPDTGLWALTSAMSSSGSPRRKCLSSWSYITHLPCVFPSLPLPHIPVRSAQGSGPDPAAPLPPNIS